MADPANTAKAGPAAGAAASQPAAGNAPTPGPDPDSVGSGAKRVRLAHRGDTWNVTVNDKKFEFTGGEWTDVSASFVKPLVKAAKRDRVHLRVSDPE